MVPNGNRNNNNDTGQVDSRLESSHSQAGRIRELQHGYDYDRMVIKEIVNLSLLSFKVEGDYIFLRG